MNVLRMNAPRMNVCFMNVFSTEFVKVLLV